MSRSEKTVKVEIYSDVVCPWCYVGKARFERALAAFPQGDSVEVVYRPFQLDPSAPAGPRPHREVLEAKFGPRAAAMDERITELGAAEGLTFAFDDAVENNTLLAHRLLRFALDEYGAGAQVRLKGRLLADHFTHGKDIGNPDHLTEAAAAEGLDAARVSAFLAGDGLRAEVLADIAHARDLGITAVPTYVFEGKWAVQGGQETSAFLRALEQVAKETARIPAATTSGTASSAEDDPADGCADGACEVR